MELVAIETIIPYAEQPNTDTGEVALKLEEEYKIVETFYNKKEKEFQERFMKYFSDYLKRTNDYQKSFNNSLRDITAWLRNEYLKYMTNNETGIITKASQERGSASFIDTGNYYSNLYFEIEK